MFLVVFTRFSPGFHHTIALLFLSYTFLTAHYQICRNLVCCVRHEKGASSSSLFHAPICVGKSCACWALMNCSRPRSSTGTWWVNWNIEYLSGFLYFTQHSYFICLSPVCFRIWLSRLVLVVSPFPHVGHSKLGAPWVALCFFRS